MASLWHWIQIITDSFYFIAPTRLLAAALLGGIIGYERESVDRPAGFRTHILVCIGSALVMVTSEYTYRKYVGITPFDPTRMGAQVISGIGFLGAGTIIREGFTVRGLTTAATLWAVSCVGIAAGIGFYEGAVAAAVLIYLTLILLKKMEHSFARKTRLKIIFVEAENIQGITLTIGEIMKKHNAGIKSIEFLKSEGNDKILVKFIMRFSNDWVKGSIIAELQNIEGVHKVYEG